jgi:hypothetical protein
MMDGFGNPGWYSARYRPHVLGAGGTYAVNLNDHTDVDSGLTEEDASREAARRNFERGSYPRPRQLGLEGAEA